MSKILPAAAANLAFVPIDGLNIKER